MDKTIDWEFWTALTEDFSSVALKLPHLVSAKLRAGIPSKVRGVIWQAMSQSASLNLETVYGQLVAEHSPYERIIQRDLARTFPGIDMFKQEGGDGQQSLERVLKAYSLYDSLVGYCQGLAFLVGPLLLNVSVYNRIRGTNIYYYCAIYFIDARTTSILCLCQVTFQF